MRSVLRWVARSLNCCRTPRCGPAIESATTGLLSVAERHDGAERFERARIASAVSAMLGGGALGDVVGAQVADAVVGLLTNPTLSAAPWSIYFDTVLTDFFGSTGVVAAFSRRSDIPWL